MPEETDYFSWSQFAQQAEAYPEDREVDILTSIAQAVRNRIIANQTSYDQRHGSNSFVASRFDPEVRAGMDALWARKYELSEQDRLYVSRFMSSLGLVRHHITG